MNVTMWMRKLVLEFKCKRMLILVVKELILTGLKC